MKSKIIRYWFFYIGPILISDWDRTNTESPECRTIGYFCCFLWQNVNVCWFIDVTDISCYTEYWNLLPLQSSSPPTQQSQCDPDWNDTLRTLQIPQEQINPMNPLEKKNPYFHWYINKTAAMWIHLLSCHWAISLYMFGNIHFRKCEVGFRGRNKRLTGYVLTHSGKALVPFMTSLTVDFQSYVF